MKTYDFPGRFNDSQQSGNADMKKKDKKVLSPFTSRKVLLPPQNSSEERLRDFSTNFAACITTKIISCFSSSFPAFCVELEVRIEFLNP